MKDITNYTKEDFEKMHTVQLFNLLKSSRHRVNNLHLLDENEANTFKELFNNLKSVLATREHVPSKQEKAEARKQKQLDKQNR